jgi:hypothetical protein
MEPSFYVYKRPKASITESECNNMELTGDVQTMLEIDENDQCRCGTHHDDSDSHPLYDTAFGGDVKKEAFEDEKNRERMELYGGGHNSEDDNCRNYGGERNSNDDDRRNYGEEPNSEYDNRTIYGGGHDSEEDDCRHYGEERNSKDDNSKKFEFGEDFELN